MDKKTNSRRAAAFVIARWLMTKDFPATLLPEGPDRAFVQDLVYTVIRRLRPLRKVLGALVTKWPKGELEALLYVGAAQVLYMDEVPDFAAVNETVEAAKACDNKSIAKVVNGVLRNLIRRRAEFEAQVAAAPLEERESFPTELVRRWTARFGADGAAKLCAWHNRPAITYLAMRPDVTTASSGTSSAVVRSSRRRLPRRRWRSARASRRSWCGAGLPGLVRRTRRSSAHGTTSPRRPIWRFVLGLGRGCPHPLNISSWSAARR